MSVMSTRTNVYSYPPEQLAEMGDEPGLAGWFEYSKAERWSDADYNGNGSGGTGRGQAVLRTSGGKWVLETWSRWQGESNRYEYITDDAAREWLLRNEDDDTVARFFGEIAEEEDRRPGRPEVGNVVNVRLGDLLSRVDNYASTHGHTRAEAIRILLSEALG